MDDHPVAWFHETNFPAQRRRASRAREHVGHPLRTERSPGAQMAGGRAVALQTVVAIPRLGGHSPSRPVTVRTETKDIDDRPRRVGTDQPVHNHEDLLGVVDGLLEEQDPHVDPRKAYAYQGSWQDAPRYRTLLNGSCTSLPGTDGLGQPLFLATQDDPMSGLGGHAQVDRGDGVSRRV